jgi:hypothetical protein
VTDRDRPPCGTDAAYQAHMNAGEPTEECGCKTAHSAYNRKTAKVRAARRAKLRAKYRDEYETLRHKYLKMETPGFNGYNYAQSQRAIRRALAELDANHEDED